MKASQEATPQRLDDLLRLRASDTEEARAMVDWELAALFTAVAAGMTVATT